MNISRSGKLQRMNWISHHYALGHLLVTESWFMTRSVLVRVLVRYLRKMVRKITISLTLVMPCLCQIESIHPKITNKSKFENLKG